MTLRAPLFLGDLIAAFAVLAPEDETTRRAMGAALGFHWGSVESALPAAKPETPRLYDGGGDSRKKPVQESQSKPSNLKKPPPRDGLRRLKLSVPKWMPRPETGTGDMQAINSDVMAVDVDTHVEEPLLNPAWERQILINLARSPALDGDLDLEALLCLSVRGRPVPEIPRLPRWRVRRSLHLFLDMGRSLEPFEPDYRRLLEELVHGLGPRGLYLHFYQDCPVVEAGASATLYAEDFVAPQPDSPILLVGDLGMTGRTNTQRRDMNARWRRFASDMKKQGCTLAVLALHRDAVLDNPLKGLAQAVLWDRSTGFEQTQPLQEMVRW